MANPKEYNCFVLTKKSFVCTTCCMLYAVVQMFLLKEKIIKNTVIPSVAAWPTI